MDVGGHILFFPDRALIFKLLASFSKIAGFRLKKHTAWVESCMFSYILYQNDIFLLSGYFPLGLPTLCCLGRACGAVSAPGGGCWVPRSPPARRPWELWGASPNSALFGWWFGGISFTLPIFSRRTKKITWMGVFIWNSSERTPVSLKQLPLYGIWELFSLDRSHWTDKFLFLVTHILLPLRQIPGLFLALPHVAASLCLRSQWTLFDAKCALQLNRMGKTKN